MALRDLTTEEMLEATRGWVTPGDPVHDALSAMPQTHAVLELFEQAHSELERTQPKGEQVAERIAQLTIEMTRLDSRHDRKMRAVGQLLLAAADADDDAGRAKRWRGLYASIFPEGMAILTQPYAQEAGRAEQLEQELTDDSRQWLGELLIGGVSALAILEEGIAAAKELGHTQRARAELVQGGEGGEDDASLVLDARGQWLQSVRTLLSVVHLAEVDDELVERMAGPLQRAEVKATSRRRAGHTAT